jgi:hypothetical protein
MSDLPPPVPIGYVPIGNGTEYERELGEAVARHVSATASPASLPPVDPAAVEAIRTICPTCQGTGHVDVEVTE